MFTVISDGGCDFTKEEAASLNVEIIPFYITFDGETHLKEGIDITKEAFFQRLIADKDLHPKTAQPNPQDYIDLYTPHLQAGKDILSLTISSKLSGSYNSAILAVDLLKEEYPERKIVVLDSLSVSVGQGLILREILKMRTIGYSLERTLERAEQVRATTQVYITLDSLVYLKKGGRIGPTTAFVGGILGLRPILQIVDGAVSQMDSVRGKKNAYKLIREGIVAALKDSVKEIELAVGHIQSEADATTFKVELEEALDIKIPTGVAAVGAALGAHAGPGAFAFAYCKKYTEVAGKERVAA